MIEFNKEDFVAFLPNWEKIKKKFEKLNESRPLPPVVLQKLNDTFRVEWTFHSNHIEGNSLTLQETHLVIREGLTVKDKTLREHFEAFNHDQAIAFLEKLIKEKWPLSVSAILEVHSFVLRSIEDYYAGRIRKAAVRLSGANFIPPNARKVPDLLEELVDYVMQNPDDLNMLELITVFHHRFVWIHPFFDGNGRTIRLIMNLYLMQAGFPPAIIMANDRKKYYRALQLANQGKYQKLGLLIAQAMERSLNIYLSVIPGNDEDDYLPIGQLVEEVSLPYGQEYISLLARRGKIDAYKEGRIWYTSEAAVKKYANH